MNKREYRETLKKSIKVIPAGERHRHFPTIVFTDLPSEYKITHSTPLILNEYRTPVCYAGDIMQDRFEIYWIQDIDWMKNIVKVVSIEERGRCRFFYTDAVSLIPKSIVPRKKQVLLLDDTQLIELDKEKRKIRARDRQIQVDSTGSVSASSVNGDDSEE